MVKKFFASSAMFGPYLMSFDLYDRAPAIACPTLLIHGDQDVIPTEAIERMGRAIRQAEVHIIPDCGHFVHLERPDEYFRIIRSFLGRAQQ
jgi:pimeloyl-ACP methyl ester carboxylesterase